MGVGAGTFIQAEALITTENILRIKVRDFHWRSWVLPTKCCSNTNDLYTKVKVLHKDKELVCFRDKSKYPVSCTYGKKEG